MPALYLCFTKIKCKNAAVLLTEFYSPYSSTSNQLKLVKQCSFAMFQILYVILREDPSKKNTWNNSMTSISLVLVKKKQQLNNEPVLFEGNCPPYRSGESSAAPAIISVDCKQSKIKAAKVCMLLTFLSFIKKGIILDFKWSILKIAPIALLIMTSEVFILDGVLNFKKSAFLGQNWCHVIYTYQHNNQFLLIMLVSSKSTFFCWIPNTASFPMVF